MNVTKLKKPQPDDDSGDAYVAKPLKYKEEPGLQKEKPGLQKEKSGLQKVADAQQVRPLCPSPRWVHG